MKEEVALDGNHFVVRDQKTRVISGGEPGTIPWDAYDVDVVIDATGRFLKEMSYLPTLIQEQKSIHQ